ncbi:MAG: aldo/keto reductase [Oscillospiraceae bacterium]|nr:aldo/keto reductase [Oscillospiraceae bacterium]
MNIPKKELSNGVVIPMIGFGTWQLEQESCYQSVLDAIEAGYRSIDTAKAYNNEEYVGRAIKDCGLDRDEIFVTTKLWNADQGYESTMAAFELSMSKLCLDVLDLYLIHWPGRDRFVDTWKAMEKLYNEGRIRAIGVSNFMVHHLEQLIGNTSVVPVVNQLESHPYLNQTAAEEFCVANGILVEAWSPLMSGKTALGDPVISGIAAAHSKTSAQVILNWHINQERRVIPRSSNQNRIRENIDIFDFELTVKEVDAINSLAVNNIRTGPNPDTYL